MRQTFMIPVSPLKVTEAGCWEWPVQDYAYAPSRLVYRLFVGDLPKGVNACHSCDNPKCYNPAHLFPGTQQQNMDDAKRKGRAGNVGRGSTRVGNMLRVNLSLEHETLKLGKLLAQTHYLSFSSFVRKLIREEAERRLGEEAA